ncbi:MAG: (2Fe-2S)-binding protein [Acidimicrobiales bacterium]|nr:Rieske 2Fe-2S domain-containing protein [Hyphomonadaceae bacterium]RZV41356.1 MAG: (2Fe-2S)-binding protein [Acidimicrobiales bacterium]
MKTASKGIWQPIALSESIGSEVPIRVCYEAKEVALFRDGIGKVRALKDRCPHRRVPLSLGKVIEGELRCAYHGWTFDGSSGACTQIPNLSDEEKVPSRYKVDAYSVHEDNGFVFLWSGQNPPSKDGDKPVFAANEDLPLYGNVIVPLATSAYRLAMLDGPETLIGIHNIGFTDFFLGDPVTRDGIIQVERNAGWIRRGKPPSKWATDYPFILRTISSFEDGTIIHQLFDDKEQIVAQIYMSIFPGTRSTTNIVWRGNVNFNHKDAGKISRTKAPIDIFSHLDGEAIANLLVGPSSQFQEAV